MNRRKPIRLLLFDTFRTVRTVLLRPAYAAIGLAVALLIFVILVWLPSHEFITYTLRTDTFSFTAKLRILFASLGAFMTNFSASGRVVVAAVSLLSGVNAALLAYHVGQSARARRAGGASMFGVVVGTLGIGCGACGSVVLSTFFGIGTASAVVAALPFKGLEFSIISILILTATTVHISRRIRNPAPCAVPTQSNQ